MRIFGKILQTFKLSRRSSSCCRSRRYSSLLYQNSLHPYLRRSQRNVNTRSVGSKPGTTPPIKKHDPNILPVALIKSKSSTSPMVMLIPINLFEGDEEAAKNTLTTLSIIRQHARQIEAFTDNLMESSFSKNYLTPPIAATSSKPILNDFERHDELASWNKPLNRNQFNDNTDAVALYDGLEKSMAEYEMNRIEIYDAFEVAAWNTSKRQLFAYVPESLEEKLKQMAISSMQLAFEMDMSNIRDAIIMSSATKNIDLFKPPTPKSIQDPTLTITTNLEIETPDDTKTIPLSFNALIQGTVEIDPSKFTPENLGHIRVPEFNDYVTAIAANICSTALQKGFPADISRMSYSTKSASDAGTGKETKRNPHIVCVREGDKGCVSPGNAELPPFTIKGGSGSGSGSGKPSSGSSSCKPKKAKKSKATAEISLLSSSAIIGDYSPRGLMSCKAYARALVEAAKRREALAKAKACEAKKKMSQLCAQPSAKPSAQPSAKPSIEELKNARTNKATCASLELTKKKPTCGSTKNNPCGKDPDPHPCKEFNEEKERAKKKQDKVKKGDKPTCKHNPCKSAKNDKPPCQNPDDCHRGDPCFRKEPNPCGTGPIKKKPPKKPVCPNQPPDRCNIKEDACYRKRVQDEEERCRKRKKSTCILDDPCKHHPCEKVDKDRCEKNKKKCASTEANVDVIKSKCEPKSTESKGEIIKSKCESKNPEDKVIKSKCSSSKKEESKCSPPKKSDSKCSVKKSESKCDGSSKDKKEASKCSPPKKSDSKCSVQKSESKCDGSSKDKKEASKCSPPKKSDSKCSVKKSESKCDGSSKDKKEASKCSPPKKSDSKCSVQKSESKSGGSSKDKKEASKCSPTKKSDSKCSVKKSESKCDGSSKDKKEASKCSPPKKSDSKCSVKKSESKCDGSSKDKKEASKCSPPKKSDSKCSLKKSESKCDGSSKDKKEASKCSPPKKSESKCGGSSKDSSSKCDSKKSESKCESSKKSESKSAFRCADTKSASKCPPPKKSKSDSKLSQSKCKTEDPCGIQAKKGKSDTSGSGADLCASKKSKSSCGINPCANKSKCGVKKSASKCSAKKSKSESVCGSSKKSESKCDAPKKTDSKCGAPKKCESTCDGASKDKKEESKCSPPKKSDSKCSVKQPESKCGSSKKTAPKCEPKKCESKCSVKKSESKCGSSKGTESKCGSPKKSESKCGSSKESESKCGSPKKSESKCSVKKSESKCGSSKGSESKCGSPKKSESKCGSSKESESKCGSPKKSESKCSVKKSESKCGSSKGSESKCGSPKKSESKCGPKKSNSESTVIKSKVKCSPQKSESKCGSPQKSESKCGSPQKSESKCGSSKESESKCGSPKKSESKCSVKKSESKCGSSKGSESKCGPPKKSESKCGSSKNTAPKCEPKKSESKCSVQKSESKCGSSKGSESKCGSPKKSESKCGSSKGSESKCGSPKKSESKCGSSKGSESKCGSPKKSESKCSVKKSESKCGSSKGSESKCGSSKNTAPKCEPKKSESKCSVKKSESKSGSSKGSESKCGSSKGSESKSAAKCPSKKSETTCGSSEKSESKCSAQKSESKCGSPEKSESKCGSPKKSDSKCGSAKESTSKCESKCAPKKSESKCDAANKCESACSTTKDTESKCSSSKDDAKKSKSQSSCSSQKKETKPNCPNKNCPNKNFSTSSLSSKLVEIFPIRRNFSSRSSLALVTMRNFSSKCGDDKADYTVCGKLTMKKPRVRKHIKARTKPVNCYDDPSICQEVFCKDEDKTSCGKNKKENKNSSSLNFSTNTQTTRRLAYMQRRTFGTIENYNECNVYEDENNLDKYQNEVVKIAEPCKVEKVFEDIPSFSDYDVLIRTEAVALAGSDLHFYETGGRSFPGMTLGHDASGVIEKVGRCINALRPGDRVAIESGLSCGICDFCKRGCYNICNQLIFNGFLSKYQVHPADLCHKMPNDVSMEDGCLTQTVALGCQACFKAQVKTTSNVLVIGSSPTAVSSALCARALGVKEVCIACTIRDSLDLIKRHFNIECVLYEPSMQFTEILESIYSGLHSWPDSVINCAVSEQTMNLAVMALKPCGVCVLAECDTECVCFNAMDMLMKNIKLLPSFRSINMFPTALQLIQSGKAPIGLLVAKIFNWDQVEMAFRSALHESNVGNRKVIVRCAEGGKSNQETKI